ncbi:MAG: RNA-binding domain-containing protein [Candidatus Thermoplasmatota archaeon]|nr:RNA-binding domain-containing protein [Candidatus Thermoplasmatota archaeon]
MSVHNVTWYATASGVASEEVVFDALRWLTGEKAEITREKVRSYHGSRMIMLKSVLDRKKIATNSISNLGSQLLKSLEKSEDLETRIDSNNVLHIRLSLASLANGHVVLSSRDEEQVKGRMKLEVYPGQLPIEIARIMLSNAAKIAEENNLPTAP